MVAEVAVVADQVAATTVAVTIRAVPKARMAAAVVAANMLF